MSDNAASGDRPEQDVHPQPAPPTPPAVQLDQEQLPTPPPPTPPTMDIDLDIPSGDVEAAVLDAMHADTSDAPELAAEEMQLDPELDFDPVLDDNHNNDMTVIMEEEEAINNEDDTAVMEAAAAAVAAAAAAESPAPEPDASEGPDTAPDVSDEAETVKAAVAAAAAADVESAAVNLDPVDLDVDVDVDGDVNIPSGVEIHVEDVDATNLDDESFSLAAALSEIPPEDDGDDVNHLDPDTLANLAALSSIAQDAGEDAEEPDEEDVNAAAAAAIAAAAAAARHPDEQEQDEHDHEHNEEQAHDQDFSALLRQEALQDALTSEQVQEIVNNLGGGATDDESDVATPAAPSDQEAEEESDKEAEDDTSQRDSEYRTPRTYYEDGKLKRRRNRTVLSCTECHRRCDRNIPCSRCIKRGVPSMCRMESPAVQPRKKKKPNEDVPITFELGLRVQALESLIRSGSNVDPEAAQTAALETVMQATRAANSGQPEAANALAQLSTASANLGIGALNQDAQSSLLLDVLQQLSAASMGRTSNFSAGDTRAAIESRDMWTAVPAATLESATQTDLAFEEDPTETKLNLTVPGFRDGSGKIFLPPTMRHAEKRLREDNLFNPGVLPVHGYEPFLEAGTRFGYGDESHAFKNQRIAAVQALGVTGALRLAASFLSRFPAPVGNRSVYVPSPSSDEDVVALREGGLEIKHYRFLDAKMGAVDWDGMKEDLQHAPPRSVILLHVSGSAPTGAELTPSQWRMLTTLLQGRQLIPLVIMAFQGLASGDTARDAQPLRFMVHEKLPVVLVQSFDAMMGLYADSPAILSVAAQNMDDKERITSQLRHLARAMYMHPPLWGAQLAHMVLSDPKLYPAWVAEIKAMADRLRSVRDKLHDTISLKLKTPGTWGHLKRGAGMYCALLLPAAQTEALTTKRHLYLLKDGCLSLGCLDVPKIETLARSVDWVTREAIREAEEQHAQSIAMELALQAATEQQARQEAEEAEAAAAAEAAIAQAEDTMLIEQSIQSAMEAQRVAEEEEHRREEEQRLLEEQVRKAAERAEIARQAELILATI